MWSNNYYCFSPFQFDYLYMFNKISFHIRHKLIPKEGKGRGYVKAAIALLVDYKGFIKGNKIQAFQDTYVQSHAVTAKPGMSNNSHL